MQPPNESQKRRMQQAFSDARAAAESHAVTQQLAAPGFSAGSVIGKCRVLRELGRGGMGAVYLGQHLTLDIPVAIKVLPAEIARKSPDYAERFLREARLAAKLRHPNVLAIMDADRDPATGLYYMITEFMDGGSVGDRLAKGPLSEKQASIVAAGVAKALQMAEKQGIVHRDIKPGNILYSRDGRVKLADLGLAKLQGTDDITKSSSAIGTPYYMSPEQIEDSKRVDIRSDIYSLGATYFHMLTGQPPYPGNDVYNVLHKVMTAPVPDPREVRVDLTESTAGIVKRMLEKDASRRYQTPSAVLSDLTRGQVSAPEGAAPPPGELELEPAGSAAGVRAPSAVARSADGVPPQVDLTQGGAIRRGRPWVVVAVAAGFMILLPLFIKVLRQGADSRPVASTPEPAPAEFVPDVPEPDRAVSRPVDPPPPVVPPPPDVTAPPVAPVPAAPKRPLAEGALLALTFEPGTLSVRGNDAVVEDGTGKAGAGILRGGAATGEGRIGRALVFDGANDAVELPAVAERTVAMWVRPDQPLQMGWYDGGGFQVGTFRPYGFKARAVAVHGVFVATGAADLALPCDDFRRGWHHVVVSWDGARAVRVLVDGQALDGHTVTAEGPWEPTPAAQPFALPSIPAPDPAAATLLGRLRGPWWQTGQEYFRGALDEVAVWGREMTLEEMRELWDLSSAGTSYCEAIRQAHAATAEVPVDPPPAVPPGPADPPAVPPAAKTPEETIAEGCVAAFTFEHADASSERARPRLLDVSGSGNDAPLGAPNSPRFRLGRVGQGMAFDGASRLVLPGMRVRTLAAWVFLEEQRSGILLGAGRTGVQGRALLVGFHEAGTWPHWRQDQAGIDLGFWSLDAVAPAPGLGGEWHHIVASWDGDRTVRLAVDGKVLGGDVLRRQEKTVHAGPHVLPDTPVIDETLAVAIGGIAPGDPAAQAREFPGFRGVIDDLALWNRALTAEEIAALARFASRKESYCDGIRKGRK